MDNQQRARIGSGKTDFAVVTKLLSSCGMISGAGSPDTAIAGLAVNVPQAPEVTCNRDLEVRSAAICSLDLRQNAGEFCNPISSGNRMNQVFRSELSDLVQPGKTCGLSTARVLEMSDREVRLNGVKELNLFENFYV